MAFSSTYISYQQTGAFSKIVEDYLSRSSSLKEFYKYEPELSSVHKAIADRKDFPYNRKLLCDELSKQYSGFQISYKTRANIDSLADANCFTVCTAHQPNIFTGHLYFIYKIVHAIRLAAELNEEFPENHFVPVYYMGSEDADLEELGEITVDGKQFRWHTDQKGAVGRMFVDASLISIIDALDAQLSVEPFGAEIISLLRDYYVAGQSIEAASFGFVNALFADRGLVILLPDNPSLKKAFHEIIARELFTRFSNTGLSATIQKLSANYKIQADGRAINLFYLTDNLRERIEPLPDGFRIANTELHFTTEEIRTELETYPERFSANVILRPLFQEMLLPNIAFIGGGGELAYWLEVKNVFETATIPFPILILRNSFLLLNEQLTTLTKKLGMGYEELFKSANTLLENFVKKNSEHRLDLSLEKENLTRIYNDLQQTARVVDPGLQNHIAALSQASLKKITNLEKKMLRAEKRRNEAAARQITKLKSNLFPDGSLQERVENFIPFYAKSGKEFISELYRASLSFGQQFCILEEG